MSEENKPTKRSLAFDREIREISAEAEREFRLAAKRAEKRLADAKPAPQAAPHGGESPAG